MSQTQMTQAAVQFEAARELAALVKPLFQKIIHGVRSQRSTDQIPAAAAAQPKPAPQNSSGDLIGQV